MLNQKSLSVIMPVRDVLPYIQASIESLRKNIDLTISEIIIIDNCSISENSTWLKTQSDLTIIKGFPEQSVPVSYNKGLKLSTGESILLMHSDTILPQNTIARLEKLLYSDEKIATVGPVSSGSIFKFQNPKVSPLPFSDFIELEHSAVDFHLKRLPSTMCLFLEDFCFLLKRSAFEKNGLFDEYFSPHYLEIIDYSLRLLNNGYSIMVDESTLVYHYGALSMTNAKFSSIDIINNAFEKFKDKWGIDLNYSGNTRFELLGRIDLKKSNLSVLEVGCAMGGNFAYIKSFNPNARLCGIEFNEHTAKIASHFADVRAADIETINITEWDNSFDYIILADILEHLRNPEKALHHMHRLLKPNGHLIISVPNISYLGVIKQLLHGRFIYENSGILDRTHLRFFTKFDMLELLKKSGFSAECFGSYTIDSLNEFDEQFLNELANLSTIKVDRDNLLTIQYYFDALKI